MSPDGIDPVEVSGEVVAAGVGEAAAPGVAGSDVVAAVTAPIGTPAAGGELQVGIVGEAHPA
jgi:hypothetical protein